MKLNLFVGIILLFLYASIVYIVARIYIKKKRTTKSGFLVADREVSMWKGSFSIASSWVWAPSMFVAAQKAYQEGIVGFFWFTIPNVLCLIIFSHFAVIIRNKVPYGFTFSDYMRSTYGKRVHGAYLFQSLGLLICSIAVQLLAGGKIISAITGLPYFWTTIFLAMIALGYSSAYGLRASIVTDLLKINILFGIGLLLIPWSIVNGGGIVSVWNGIGGFSGKFTNLFDRNGIAVFLNFGIPVTIGLMSGPFGDQAFWQRAFAVKKEKVRSSFIIGAFIFGAVPLLMSFLGFLGAGLKFVPKEAQFINLEIVLRLLPAWTLALFAYMIMSGLISALDSHMTAILSVGGHDLINSFSKKGNSECDKRSVKWARTSAILVTILAITIANIPGMQILYLFLFYGTLRASTLMPTVITLLSKKPISETGVFWGIVVSVCIGLPIFAYGNFKNELSFTVTGSLLTVLASGIITLSFRKNLKHKQIL